MIGFAGNGGGSYRIYISSVLNLYIQPAESIYPLCWIYISTTRRIYIQQTGYICAVFHVFYYSPKAALILST